MHPLTTRPVVRTAIGLAAAAALGLAGCSSDDTATGGQTTGDQTSAAGAPTSAPATSAPASSAPATSSAAGSASGSASSSGSAAAGDDQDQLIAAAALAEKESPGGARVTSIETEDSGQRWEITTTAANGTEYDVDVSADGKTVQRGPTKQNDDARDLREQRAEVAAAKIDYREAVRAVTKAASGRITELNVDAERGKSPWEATVIGDNASERSVTIDAGNGSLISNRADD